LDPASFQTLPETPLSDTEKEFMAAVMSGDLNTVEELLCKHGPPLLEGHGGGGVTATAILYAARAGNQDICDVMVDKGGVQILSRGRDVNNLGPAEHAEKAGHLELALHLRSLDKKSKELANMHRRPSIGNHKLS